MDRNKLLALTEEKNELLADAVKKGDRAQALSLLQGVGKKVPPMAKNIWQTAGYIFDYLDEIFQKAHALIVKEIEEDINKDDFKGALSKIKKMNQQFLILHDLSLDIVIILQSFIARNYGEQFLFEVLRFTGEKKKAWFEEVIRLPIEEIVKQSAKIMKMHKGKFTIEEDDKKFTFIMDPCGSGGRRWRNEASRASKFQYLISSPHAMNLGQKGLPVYCAHCPTWNSLLPIEWFGVPLWVFDLPKKSGDVCKMHIYKDPNDIPEEYYKLLGKGKHAIGKPS